MSPTFTELGRPEIEPISYSLFYIVPDRINVAGSVESWTLSINHSQTNNRPRINLDWQNRLSKLVTFHLIIISSTFGLFRFPLFSKWALILLVC